MGSEASAYQNSGNFTKTFLHDLDYRISKIIFKYLNLKFIIINGQFRQMVNLILNFPKSIQMNNLYLFENLIMWGF